MRTLHHVLLFAILSSGIPLLTGCVSSSAYDRTVAEKNSEIRGLKKKNREQRQAIEGLSDKNQQLKEDIETLRSKLDLAESAPVTSDIKNVVSQTEGFSIGDRGQLRLKGDLLFSPGSAEIKDSAKQALSNLATAIQNRDQTSTLMIAGHTDNQPIQASAPKWKTDTNMELGAHRALNVFLFLKNQGINPENMYIASFGEYRPRVSNNSSDNRAKNRRVEIRLLQGAAHQGAGTQSGSVNKGGSSSGSGSTSSPQKGK
jgi:chemotaxis protein MotB